VSKGDVIKKFKSLHATYFVTRGAMISTVPDILAEQFIRDAPAEYVWHERYCSYASNKENIRTVTVDVPVFGKWFEVGLDRPLVPEHRSEFEEYFGFGGHCDGYSENRIVFRFLNDVNTSQGSIQSILLPEGRAVSELETWFIDVAGLREIIEAKNGLAVYIFEHMRPK